jgi:hypothetical protein
MAHVNIPDELAQRVQSHLKARGEDLATFTARAFDELLSIDEDPVLQAELIEKTRRGFDDLDASRITELRHLSAELGIRPER